MASSEKKTRKKTRDSGASAGGKDEPGEDGPFRLLHDLPTELLLACAVFLPPSDLIRLGGCDKYLNEVSKSPVLWVKLLQRPFPWAAADESLGAKIAAVWPELAFLADRSFVETAKILLFAPRSVPSLSASRRRLIDPRSICPHLASPAIAEIPALRELFDNLLGSDFCSKSASKPVCAGPLHGYSADSPVPGFSGAELYTSCPHGPPDLWICLHPDCLSVRCGRTRNAHALMHYASENERNGGHQVAIKVSTLELWCYSCGRWLGVPYSHPLEILRLRSLGLSLLGLPTDPEPGFLSKKVMERGDKAAVLLEWMRNLRRQEERFWSIMWDSANPVGQIYLIGQPFIPHWNKFVVGNGPPPPTNSHASLYRTPQPNQPLVPHPQAHVFGAGFLSARDIEKFMARYPSTEFPPLSENDIPSTPEYAQLRRFIDAHKRGAEGNPEEADDGEWVFFAAGDDDEVMMGQLEDLAL